MKKEIYYCDQCGEELPQVHGMYVMRGETNLGIIDNYSNLKGIRIVDAQYHFCREKCLLKYIHEQLKQTRLDAECQPRDKITVDKE
jgi:hypothetical protein